MKKLFLTMLGFLIVLPAFAHDFQYTYMGQTIIYTVVDDNENTCRTKEGSESNPGNNISGSLVLPSEVKDGNRVYKLVEISDYSFYKCSITSISIPNTVITLGKHAFTDNDWLNSVFIPSSVTSIGECTFANCNRLTSVNISNSVTSIGRGAFTTCNRLTSIRIPSSVTEIGEWAFHSCSSLTKAEFESIDHLCSINFANEDSNPLSYAGNLYINGEEVKEVVIPNSVTSIGDYAFYGCNMSTVEIANSVTSIGSNAFRYCRSLISAVLSNSLTRLNERTFSDCTSLTTITIPNSVTLIGDLTFFNCASLPSISIPESVIEIGVCAFSGCKSLTSINLPNSVISIGEAAFNWCDELTSVSISSSVTSIGKGAFSFCFKLTKVEFSSIESLCSIQFGDGDSNPLSYTRNLFINGEVVNEVKIPDSVKKIGNFAFSNCQMTSISISNSVEEIGDYAFLDCDGLTSLKIPYSVKFIGQQAFGGCKRLTKAEFESVENICSIKFNDECSNPLFYAHNLYINGEEIEKLIIPATISSIGAYAFFNCNRLTSVYIPSSITSIGTSAFKGCDLLAIAEFTNIESLCLIKFQDWYSNPLSYARSLYINRESVDYIKIPDSIITINNFAFINCKMFSINLPASLTSIGEAAFANCINLNSIIIPDSVTSIGKGAFSSCNSLEHIALPLNLIHLGTGTFKSCTNIRDISIRGSIPIYGPYDLFPSSVYENALLYVPAGTESKFREVCPWMYFKDIQSWNISGVENITADSRDIDDSLQYQVYTLNGTKIESPIDALPTGIYIIYQRGKIKKIIVN